MTSIQSKFSEKASDPAANGRREANSPKDETRGHGSKNSGATAPLQGGRGTGNAPSRPMPKGWAFPPPAHSANIPALSANDERRDDLMQKHAQAIKASDDAVIPDLMSACEAGLRAAERLVGAARAAVARLVQSGDAVDSAALDRHQAPAHLYAWIATYAAALRELLSWARGLEARGGLTEREALILQIGFGEYLAQLKGGIPLSQGEILRPSDLGLDDQALSAFGEAAIDRLIRIGSGNEARLRLAALLADGNFGDDGLGDETLTLIRDQFRRFADEQVVPHAHGWHVTDSFVPLEILARHKKPRTPPRRRPVRPRYPTCRAGIARPWCRSASGPR